MNQFFLRLRLAHEDAGVLWSGRIPGASAVHGWWQGRTVVGARARGRCTCAEEGGRNGAQLCVYIVLYFCRMGGFQAELCIYFVL